MKRKMSFKTYIKNLRFMTFYELRVLLSILSFLFLGVLLISLLLIKTTITDTRNLTIKGNQMTTNLLNDTVSTKDSYFNTDPTKLSKENKLDVSASKKQKTILNDSKVKSAYTNDKDIKKLKSLLSKVFTFSDSEDLKLSFEETSPQLTGDVWQKVYSPSSANAKDAVSSFANTINQYQRTSSVTSITIVPVGKNHYKAIVIRSVTKGDSIREDTFVNMTYYLDIALQNNSFTTNVERTFSTV